MPVPQSLQLHHVGVAVAELAPAVESYVRRFGYTVVSPVFHDPTQTAFVQFLYLPGESSYLEFVAPDGPGSKLAGVLRKGGGLNHLCYSVADIAAAVVELRATGLVTVCEPVAAVAFPGRRIAWLLGNDRVPVELVEAGQPGSL